MLFFIILIVVIIIHIVQCLIGLWIGHDVDVFVVDMSSTYVYFLRTLLFAAVRCALASRQRRTTVVKVHFQTAGTVVTEQKRRNGSTYFRRMIHKDSLMLVFAWSVLFLSINVYYVRKIGYMEVTFRG
jgi:hypothetical protein